MREALSANACAETTDWRDGVSVELATLCPSFFVFPRHVHVESRKKRMGDQSRGFRDSFLSSHQISRDVFLATASAWHSYTPRAPTRWRWFPRNGEEDWGRAWGSPTTGTDTGTWAAPRLRDPPSPRPTQRRVVRVNACPLSVLTSAPARRFHLQRGCAHRRVGRGRRRLGSRRERPPVALERGGLG